MLKKPTKSPSAQTDKTTNILQQLRAQAGDFLVPADGGWAQGQKLLAMNPSLSDWDLKLGQEPAAAAAGDFE